MTDRLIRITTRGRRGHRRGGGHGHQLPPRLRASEHVRGAGPDGSAPPVHRGRPDSGSEHAHSRCSRRNQHVAALAHWCLGVGITATIGANLAHGIGHGPIGALVSAWPALALAGSFELLMTLTRTEHRPIATQPPMASASAVAPVVERDRRAIQTRTRRKVIHLGGRPPRSFPSRIYGGCGRVQRHAPATVLEASDMEETLAGHQEWVAAGRPGAVSHEEAMAELFGGR
jgi:hypothetical protein